MNQFILSNQTYYEILDSKQDDLIEIIKKNYHRKVLQYHPDKNLIKDKDYAKLIQQIQEAWKILNDPIQRKLYDGFLQSNENLKIKYLHQVDDSNKNFNIDNQEFEIFCEQCDYLNLVPFQLVQEISQQQELQQIIFECQGCNLRLQI